MDHIGRVLDPAATAQSLFLWFFSGVNSLWVLLWFVMTQTKE